MDHELNKLNSNINHLKIYVLSDEIAKKHKIETEIILLNNLFFNEKYIIGSLFA
jgi:predicted nicotinamide N-methyase